MSHRTTAAVRQNEMNVNITLLTTTTCAARPTDRPAGASGETIESMKSDLGCSIPIKRRGAWRLKNGEAVTRADARPIVQESGKCPFNRPGQHTRAGRR